MIAGLSQHLSARSAAILLSLEARLPRILLWWIIGAGLLTSLRIVAGPLPLEQSLPRSFAPYALLVMAPALSTWLALGWFKDGNRHPQPSTRLAIVGRWQTVSPDEAQRHSLYGTTGIMVSLLIGMMMNVPVRAAEYLMAMPPIGAHPPQWLSTLQLAMTFDVVLFTSLYMIAFVAALRRVPLFPRLLATIWICDIVAQVVLADVVGSAPGLPPLVVSALGDLLYGNVQKVLISAALWLPYLMLSTRVNVTYRSRVPA